MPDPKRGKLGKLGRLRESPRDRRENPRKGMPSKGLSALMIREGTRQSRVPTLGSPRETSWCRDSPSSSRRKDSVAVAVGGREKKKQRAANLLAAKRGKHTGMRTVTQEQFFKP